MNIFSTSKSAGDNLKSGFLVHKKCTLVFESEMVGMNITERRVIPILENAPCIGRIKILF